MRHSSCQFVSSKLTQAFSQPPWSNEKHRNQPFYLVPYWWTLKFSRGSRFAVGSQYSLRIWSPGVQIWTFEGRYPRTPVPFRFLQIEFILKLFCYHGPKDFASVSSLYSEFTIDPRRRKQPRESVFSSHLPVNSVVIVDREKRKRNCGARITLDTNSGFDRSSHDRHRNPGSRKDHKTVKQKMICMKL